MLMVERLPETDGNGPSTPGGSGMARVGLDGTYTIEHLVAGEYGVLAILPGYISPLEDVMASGFQDRSPEATRELLRKYGTVTISNAESERHDMTLARGASVSGQVLFSDGSPATQVSIELEDINAKKQTTTDPLQSRMVATMARTLFTHQSENTDDRGRFRIAGLKPGTYRVAAISSLSNTVDNGGEMGGFAVMFSGALDTAALRVYSGDTLHSKSAKTYDLRSGDDVTGIDITIPLNAYHQVRGVVTAVDGRSINQANVTLTDAADDSLHFEVKVSDEGAFTFATVSAGTYILSAKDARIIARVPGSSPDVPLRYTATKSTNAFADGKTTITVKDSDITDATLTLTEVPLPPEPKPEVDSND